MQFKHPELLWALLLLLIPLIIHLFQLRRFQKTPFTNVKFLKKVVSESRRSNVLKKWLLLLTRLVMLAGLVIAFAQPFFAEQSALQQKETIIYLDNSFSMQAKSDGVTLLENAVQSLLQSIPKDQNFTLFTNDMVFKQVSLPEAQNDLIAIVPTPKQLQLNEIYLKGNTFFKGDSETVRNLVLVSDFQRRMLSSVIDSASTMQKHLVPLTPENTENIALDSIYLDGQNSENIELTAIVSRKGSIKSTPVSLFNGEQLIAKTSAVFKDSDRTEVQFTLPKNEQIDGKLEISDTGLAYDNHLYFNIDTKEKIKVLVVGDSNSNFLKRIYPDDEFEFTPTAPKNLNYGDLGTQNLIILNEVPALPIALTTSLKSFTEGGGSLVIIPSEEIELNSYNLLTSNYFSTSFIQKVDAKRPLTNISFSHPLYRNVFVKNVTNFQYPEVSKHFKIKTTAPSVLSFQDNTPFLIGGDGKYIFTASLAADNSNFKNSPLIVPTFYNMGSNSLRLPPLYGVLGNGFSIDVSASLPDDTILKVSKGENEFIPQQKALSNKVTLTFDENLKEDGIYTISQGDTPLTNISFNFDREESDLTYLNLDQLKGVSKASSIASLFDAFEKDNRITALWKWFVILALLMLLMEVLIQKLIP
ncbi:N-terminal double-transmembrane domain-containing protein [Pricia antarctica]|uniref:N-terminal double-transmembrane domain-containing protein n=1 Tax=Pricia antarctica TaxID=641691 RepID=A0A1G7EGC1_9FLAO|nr:BatA domain-containing protein [Pricia antarctica]SDE62691.1 N-terminal double-transmembrane domain-containing protein [Pricia antarctica]